MKYVLDASVAVKWVLLEADSAIALRDDYVKEIADTEFGSELRDAKEPALAGLGNLCHQL